MMLKFVLIATLLSSSPLAAQDVAFRAGLARSTFTESTGAEPRNGILVGVDTKFPLNETFALRPGLFYVEKGSDVVTTVLGERVTGGLAVNYVQVALPIQRTVGSGSGPLGIVVQVGPWLGIRAGCDFEATVLERTSSGECGTIGFDPAATDFGLVAGTGVSYRISSGTAVGVDLRYHFGFADAFDGPAIERTRTAALLFGLAFGS